MGLIFGGCCDVADNRQMVKQDDEAAHPVNVDLFSTEAVMLESDFVAHLIKEFGCLR